MLQLCGPVLQHPYGGCAVSTLTPTNGKFTQRTYHCCVVLLTTQVNNAATLVRTVWDEATYAETLAVNVTGPLLLTEQMLPLMPSGSLVIMVSSGERISHPNTTTK